MNQQVRFDLKTFYLKDVSFESPKTPGIFTKEALQPQVDVQINISHNSLDQAAGIYEVILAVTVTAKSGDEAIFLIEAQQAGVFEMSGFTDDQLEGLLEVHAPQALFPFAREVISNLGAKGGFPQLLLTPVNFDVLYQQKKQSETAPESQSGESQVDETARGNGSGSTTVD